jgi:hypothetical protein
VKVALDPRSIAHRGHHLVRNLRRGNFAGRRLETEIMRCYTCSRLAPVSVQQIQVRRAH